MTKSQLIDLVADRSGHARKGVEVSVNALFETIEEALARSERVEVRGFGNFTVRQYRAYAGRNPKTGAKVAVPAKLMPFFKVGKDLRDRINDGAPS